MGREARNRRSRKAKVRSSRRAAHGESRPDPHAIFKTIVKGTAGLAAASAVEAEMYASSICISFRPGMGMDAAVREAFSAELIAHMRRRPTPDVVAALLGLSVIAEGPLRGSATEVAQALIRQGVQPPDWADEIGRARFGEAWLATDEFGDQDFLAIGFEDVEGGGAHTLVALIDHNLGGIAKDLSVSGGSIDQLLATWRGIPDNDLTPQEIAPEEAGSRLRNALRAYDETFEPPSSDAVAVNRQLALARLERLPSSLHRADPQPMPEPQREGLVEEFLASNHAPSGDLTPHLARTLVDFKADYADGDPLRWSPTVVELCLLDWLPRKVMLRADEIEALPEVVRGWAAFAGERRGTSASGIDQTLAAVDQLAPRFAEAMTDGADAGPAKALFAAMMDDGVDTTDQAAIDRWIAGFNQRPWSERDLILGPPDSPTTPAGSHDDRLALAVPRRHGTFEGSDLEALDPTDEDDLSILLRAAHDGEASDLHDPDESDMDLHVAVHEVVAHQLMADDPPETWMTGLRLLASGYEPHVVLHMLCFAVGGLVWHALQQQEPHDAAAYRRALEALPGSWIDFAPEPDA